MVFGILNIGYALWKVVGLLLMGVMMRMNLRGNSAFAAMTADPGYQAWTRVSVVIGIVFAIILIASGIGLLLMQNWARILAVIYSILEMIMVVVGAIVSQRIMAQAMTSQIHGASPGMVHAFAMIGFVMGIGIGLAYPILLLIFMTRPKIVEALTAPAASEAS